MRTEVIGNATLHLGDCRDILPTLAVSAIVTDPPYGTGWVRGGGAVGEFNAAHEKPAWDVFTTDWMDLAPHAVIAAFCAPSYLDKLCARLPGLGVIVCTGQSSVAQRVRGLRLGADDWVTKPCHPEELIARVEAVVRRRKRADVRVEKGPVVIGEVEIRADQFQAFVSGASVELTRREYELIQLLADAEGQVLQREEIYQRVWGYAMVHGDRSVDVFVRKLRSKLERVSPSWRYIHTHFGVGYRFAPEPADVDPAELAAMPDPDLVAEPERPASSRLP